MLLMVLSIVPLAVAEDDDVVDTSDELEVEADEFEQEETGDEVIEEIEEELETDEEIEEELGLTEEESAEIEEAVEKIGLKAYVLNRQLKFRLKVRIIEAGAVIEYLEEKGISTSGLSSILDDMNSLFDSLDPKEMDKDTFLEKKDEIIELVKEFKEKSKELIPEEDIPEVRERIREHREEAKEILKEFIDKELKARLLFNRKQFRDTLKEVVKDAKELRKDGKKLLETAERLRKLELLRNKFKDKPFKKAEAESIKGEWKEGVKEYGLDRAASVVKNERAQLAISAVKIKRAIQNAKDAGEDTTDLDNKLTEVRGDIHGFVPGKVISKEAVAKAKITRTKLENMGEDKRIVERVREVPVPIKKGVARRPVLVKKAIAKNTGATAAGDTQ